MRAELRRSGAGALIGLLSAAVALGVGEVVAALVRPAAAPVIAVGNRFVLLTPESVKRWAIRNFGTNDKNVLLTGIYVAVAIFAIVVGILAVQRVAYGVGGILLFGAVGSLGGVDGTRFAHVRRGADLLGTAAALAVLLLLLGRCRRRCRTVAASAKRTSPAPARRPTAVPAGQRRRGRVGRAVRIRRTCCAARPVRRLAARAAVQLPPPVDAAPALPTGVDLGKSRVPWQTPNEGSTGSIPRSAFRRSIRRTGRCASTGWLIARSA